MRADNDPNTRQGSNSKKVKGFSRFGGPNREQVVGIPLDPKYT